MNAERRKELASIIERLGNLKDDLESVRDQEEECFDNLPEQLQVSERGEAMQENYEEMDGILGDLEDIVNRIQEIIDK